MIRKKTLINVAENSYGTWGYYYSSVHEMFEEDNHVGEPYMIHPYLKEREKSLLGKAMTGGPMVKNWLQRAYGKKWVKGILALLGVFGITFACSLTFDINLIQIFLTVIVNI